MLLKSNSPVMNIFFSFHYTLQYISSSSVKKNSARNITHYTPLCVRRGGEAVLVVLVFLPLFSCKSAKLAPSAKQKKKFARSSKRDILLHIVNNFKKKSNGSWPSQQRWWWYQCWFWGGPRHIWSYFSQ